MKRTAMKKSICCLLVLAMLVLTLPTGIIVATAEDTVNLTENPSKMLGFGFNALTEGKVSTSTMINRNWIDIDSDGTKVHIFGTRDGTGVLEQYGEAIFENSSLDMMMSLGIDYTNTKSANFTVNKIKAGVENKFGADFNLTSKTTTSEAYYHYAYKAICNRYALYSDYSEYLSDEFLSDVLSIDPNSDAKIEAFFKKYGTHMLTSFETGGEVNLNAWAYSSSQNTDILLDLTQSASANVGIGDIAGASVSSSLALNFKGASENSEITSNVNYYAIGGTNLYADVADPATLTIDKDKLEKWVESLSQNPAFIPSSSEWIAVWEVLPAEEKYENVREALYQYFMENTAEANKEFLTRFCSFSNRLTINGYTYVSPEGYAYQGVPYEAVNYVAPGSTVSLDKTVDDTVFELDSVYIDYTDSVIELDEATDAEKLSKITVDRRGVIRIGSAVSDGEKVYAYVKTGDIILKTLEFEVKAEGGNVFAGGYGTESRPYLINSGAQLLSLSLDSVLATSNNYYLLSNDINMSDVSSFAGIPTFGGVFDGNGHRIYGFNITSGNNNVGFFGVNKGTVRNLTLGLPDDTSVNGYSGSVVLNAYVNINTYTAGGIVGLNTPDSIVDNCAVENVYIYSTMYHPDNNYTVYSLVGGIIGSNEGLVTRCVSANNNISTHMTTDVNTGDNNQAFAGGICGGNYKNFYYNISRNNTIKAHADVNGTGGAFKKDDYSHAVARTGGLAGYVTSLLNNSAAYGNTLSASYLGTYDDAWTTGTAAQGALIGESTTSMNSCYTTDTQYALVGWGASTGGAMLSSIDELNSQFAANEHFYYDESTSLTVNSVASVEAHNVKQSYVIEDYIDMLDAEVYGVTARGTRYKQYDSLTGEYVTSPFRVFRVSDFSSQCAGTVDMKIVSYGAVADSENAENEKNIIVKQINILDKELDSVTIEAQPYKAVYYEGEELDTTGLVFRRVYNNGDIELVRASDAAFTVSGYDSHCTDKPQTVTVSIDGFDLSFSVKVYKIKPAVIAVNTAPDKAAYAIGEEADFTGLSILLTYNNGENEVIYDGFTVSGFTSASEGTVDITVEYSFTDPETDEVKLLTTSFAVTVGTPVSVSVKTLPAKVSYYTSDAKLSLDGLTLECTYSNGVVKTVSSGWSKPYGYDLNKTGEQEVMLSYSGIVTSFDITVEQTQLTDISIGNYPKTQYYIGDTLMTDGMCLLRDYNDGTTDLEVWSGYTVMVEGYAEGERPTFHSTGTKTVTVYYSEGNVRKSVQYEITVSSVELLEIEVGQMPYKTKYKVDEEFSSAGMKINAVFNNGNVEEVTDYTVSYSFDNVGVATVSVWYLGKSTTLEVEVVGPERLVVSKLPVTDYQVGDSVSLDGIELYEVYYDGTYNAVDVALCNVDVPELTEVGDYTVTVEYNGMSAEFAVSVREREMTDTSPAIIVDCDKAIIGSTVTATIRVVNNPGIASMKLLVDFDSTVLKLTSVEYNTEIGGMTQLPQTYDSPVILNWVGGTTDVVGDFVYATLCFDVSDSVSAGDSTSITVTYDENDVYDINENNVFFFVVNSETDFINYVPGDMNGDEGVNNKDLTRLFQYLTGWDVDVNEAALDVNGDGAVNNKDLTRLMQYLSGWDVELN